MPTQTDDIQGLARRLVEPLRAWFLPQPTGGVWTPFLTGSGGGGSYTTSIVIGEYFQSNHMIFFWARYQVATLSSAPAGTLRLSGLPFVARATSSMLYPATIGYNNASLSTVARAVVVAGQSYLDFYTAAGVIVNASVMAAGTDITLAGSYPV